MSAGGRRSRLLAVWLLLVGLVGAIVVIERTDLVGPALRRNSQNSSEARLLLPVPVDQLGVIEVVQYPNAHDEIERFESRYFCLFEQPAMKFATGPELPLRRSNVVRTHVIADIDDILGHGTEDLSRATTEIEDAHARERTDVFTDETRPPASCPHEVLEGFVDEWMRQY